MMRTIALVTALLGAIAAHVCPALAQGPYEGFGAATPGGAGGSIVRVTNLNDSGPGSLREAVSGGNRTVVFDVAGTINLVNQVFVTGAFVTIDGFTAPPPGITLRNMGLAIEGTRGAHDVIVRGLRVRNSAVDGIRIKNGAYNVVIDHCSVHGSLDGNLDITESAHDVTVSWSIIAEPRGSQKNILIKYSPSRVSFHHNILVGARKRNPLVQIDNAGTPATDTTLDMRNNLVWDWSDPDPIYITYGTLIQYGARANVVNNYYSAPTGSPAAQASALIVCEGDCYAGDAARFSDLPPAPDPLSGAMAYVSGNVSADTLAVDINSEGNQPSPFPAAFVGTHQACDAARLAVEDAGVRPLDAVDTTYLSRIDLGACGAGVADLAIVALVAPPSVAPGTTLTVTEATENRGSEPVGPFHVALYLSTDGHVDANDVLLASRIVPGLGSGERSQSEMVVTLPATIAPGIYSLVAVADPDTAIVDDTSRLNNIRMAALTVGPNLVASALTVSSPVAPGMTVAIGNTITSAGQSLPSGTSVRFYLSANTTFDAGDVVLGERVLPALAGGTVDSATASVTIPPQTAAGSYHVLARVDPDGAIAEANEQDNGASAALTVRVDADLIIDALSVTSTITAGTTVPVTNVVKNNGKGPAPGSIVTFRLSRDQTYEPSDVLLGSRAVPTLGARATHSGVTSVSIPAGTAAGNYYIVGRVDTDNGAPETNVGNNTKASRRIKVQ